MAPDNILSILDWWRLEVYAVPCVMRAVTFCMASTLVKPMTIPVMTAICFLSKLICLTALPNGSQEVASQGRCLWTTGLSWSEPVSGKQQKLNILLYPL